MTYNYSAEDMLQIREMVAQAQEVSLEELDSLSDDQVVEMALEQQLIVPYTPDQMIEIREALAEKMAVSVDELADVTDAGVIELAVRHEII